jgi:hypothetical protein
MARNRPRAKKTTVAKKELPRPYQPGPSSNSIRHHFGKKGGWGHTQAYVDITKDESQVWIHDRHRVASVFNKEEAIELMRILQKTYLLDALGDC